MQKEYFYSPSTKLYVARKPLRLDARVRAAAVKNNLDLTWDDEGRINFISFDESKILLKGLGGSLLSPVEYWMVFNDALKAKDEDMVRQLSSNEFCEWLDRVYTKDGYYIDHPEIFGKKEYRGKREPQDQPYGRPGWLNPENNIDLETGHPKRINLHRGKKSGSWKYWSPDFCVTDNPFLAPIRGYVTSVGKASFDLGIPTDAKQPKQMLRECRKRPLSSLVPEKIMQEARNRLVGYNGFSASLSGEKELQNLLKEAKNAILFIQKNYQHFSGKNDSEIWEIREKYFNLLGFLYSLTPKEALLRVGRKLSQVNTAVLRFNELHKFLSSSGKRLEAALEQNRDIVFVMGHKNPDSDTVISSVFEAFRNHLIDGDKVTYVPVIQYHRIPEEIEVLLGNLSVGILLSQDVIYRKAVESGLPRWISVDQNREPEVQKYFISVIDHHLVSGAVKGQAIPKTLEFTGSCAALVAAKLLGMGIVPDRRSAKVLYGATLMDTENRVEHKMTLKDQYLMDFLKGLSSITDDNKFYAQLMGHLLSANDPTLLFKRDYKEDWGFGFAVAKVGGLFSEGGVCRKPKLLKDLIRQGTQNNRDKNLPLTLIKVTDYLSDNIQVNRERIYLIFQRNARPEFQEAIQDTLLTVLRLEFPGVKILARQNYIEFWGTGMQLSRKKTVPLLEPIVTFFNEYFYAPSIKSYVKRDFLRRTPNVAKSAKKLKLRLSKDEDGRINYIDFAEARALCDHLGFRMLSVNEYWKVRKDAQSIRDYQMLESLEGSNFVEFWDSVIVNKKYIIDHPRLEKGIVKGRQKRVRVPLDSPGLIRPNDINSRTGLPKRILPPDIYSESGLWRYWGPDAEMVFPTRSYIFLLGQPSFDCKFHLGESFPNLGIRPVLKELPPLRVELKSENESIELMISVDGEDRVFVYHR